MPANERLIILDGPHPREIVPEGDLLEVGRAPELGIVLRDPTVSRRHALVRRLDGGLTIEDAGSRFGTFVNDRPLRPGEPTKLKDGDVVRIGHAQIVCRLEHEPETVEDTVENAAFAAQANARVLVLEGEIVRRQPLAGALTLIGSAPHCEVRLQDCAAPPEAALLRALRGAYRLEPRLAGPPVRLNEAQTPVLGQVALPSNSVFVVNQAQILFLYDFGAGGEPVPDPLVRLRRRGLVQFVSKQCGVAKREIHRLLQGRARLGQAVGEILVERQVVTPLFWRVIAARAVERRGGCLRLPAELGALISETKGER